jgi:shikimate kinase
MPKEKSNVVLIGMPGCGKSTIGVLLAKRLQMAFVDTDLIIQKAEAMPLHRLIETRGMDSFCEIECGHNQKLDVSNTVIATGGSVVYYHRRQRGLLRLSDAAFSDRWNHRLSLFTKARTVSAVRRSEKTRGRTPTGSNTG